MSVLQKWLLLLAVVLTLLIGCRAPAYSQECITVYGSNRNTSSIQLRREIDAGMFRKLSVEFCFHDVETAGRPEKLPGLPAFQIGSGELFNVPGEYNGQAVMDRLRLELRRARVKPEPPVIPADDFKPHDYMADVRRIADERSGKTKAFEVPISGRMSIEGGESEPVSGSLILPVDDAAHRELTEQYFHEVQNVPEPVPDRMFEAAAVDIDWAGVRFGVLVADDPGLLRQLRGPVQRAFDHLSGGQLRIEPISQAVEPERFNAVSDALGAGNDFKLYPFALIDRVADVGLVKGIVVGKIEKAVEHQSIAQRFNLIPDLIFNRENARHYQDVLAAMGSPRFDLYDQEHETGGRGFVHTLIALIFNGTIGSVLARAWRGFRERSEVKQAEQLVLLDE